MKLWTNLHVSDSTAMQYLARVIEAHVQLGLEITPDEASDEEKSFGTPLPITHALSLVKTYPSHEAVWTYLRQTLAMLEAHEAPLSRRVHEISEMWTKTSHTSSSLLAHRTRTWLQIGVRLPECDLPLTSLMPLLSRVGLSLLIARLSRVSGPYVIVWR